MTLDQQIADLAVQQHGLVLRRQLEGRTYEPLAHRIETGGLRVITPDLLAVAGAPRTDMQRVMAAVLDAGDGAVASHQTAAALWGLPGFGFDDLSVTRGGRATSRPARLAFRHRPRLLLPHHLTAIDFVPCTTLARTVFDLAAIGVAPRRLERLVNMVANRSPGTLNALHQLLDELGTRGRAGIRAMRAIL